MSRSNEEILANIDTATADELMQVANESVLGDDAGAEQAVENEIPAAASEAATEVKTEQSANTETAPIQTKDGKHTIPYEVLANTRAAKDAAEAKLAQEAEARLKVENQLAEMQAKIDQLNANPTQQVAEVAQSTLSQEELTEMRENFPSMAKMFDTLQAQLNQVQQENVFHRQAQQQVERTQAAVSVQDFIDANPKLSLLQTRDPEGWARAVELDNVLRKNPENAKLSATERFNKVVAGYESMYGVINSPVAIAQKQTPVKSVADAMASAKVAAPNSLGDLPAGGTEESITELSGLQNQSSLEIHNAFSRMTPKQQADYLNSLG